MKRTLLVTGIALSLMACNNPQQTKPEAQLKNTVAQAAISGIDLSNIDHSVRPQDDFYRYVNGLWLKKFELPADKSNYGAFTALGEESRERVKGIINQVSKMENVAGSDEQKIADLYKSFMDTTALEEQGLDSIAGELQKIQDISNKKDLSAYLGYADVYQSAPFGMYVYVDQKQSDQYVVYFSQGGLGLPDRDYYTKDDAKAKKIQQAYIKHIGNMLQLAGIKNPQKTAQKVYDLEKDLAQNQWTRVENRDSEKTYNKMSFDEFSKNMSSVDWDAWLSNSMIDKPQSIVVNQPTYFQALNKIIAKYDLNTWKDYFTWHLISASAPYLSSDFDKENFAFYGTVLSGTTEQEPRWKRGVDLVNGVAGELVGKVYVKQYFPPQAKKRMVKMIENLSQAYGDSIKELDWMSEPTKLKALDKLAKFDPKVGYPDKWRDYSGLNVTDGGLVSNMKEATRFLTHRNRSKLGKPIDRTEWGMNPQTVNAYYNPVKNEIVFPAAILQPPFFNLQADEAVNYGGIGAVIGHEMGHGFDDQGSKYDGDGNMKNWWTEEDRKKFEQRTAKLIKQYDAFTVVDGTHVKGDFTQGENIGDLSGLTISYKAFKANYKDDKVIDGLTPDQRFFMGWAQVWMRKYRDAELLKRIDTDPHSPSEFRANGILRNLPEFYQAFDVKEGDKMYLKPEDRVKIW